VVGRHKSWRRAYPRTFSIINELPFDSGDIRVAQGTIRFAARRSLP
jgi:hypothetical protein